MFLLSQLPEDELVFCLGIWLLACDPGKNSPQHLTELLCSNEMEFAIYCTDVTSWEGKKNLPAK